MIRRKFPNEGQIFIAPSTRSGRPIPFAGLFYRLFLKKKVRKFRGMPGMYYEESAGPTFYRRAKPSDVDGFEINEERDGVGAWVPSGFEAYAWLPNPAWKWVAPETEGARLNHDKLWTKPVRWSEVASANDKEMDSHTYWGDICGPCADHGHGALSPDQNWTWAPTEQYFEPEYANVLFDILSQTTSLDERCLSGKWEGSSTGWETNVTIGGPSWLYFVRSHRFGDLINWINRTESFARESNMPNVIWPENRAWFVAILYSASWNYIAGSRELVDAVLASELEAYEIAFDDQSP